MKATLEQREEKQMSRLRPDHGRTDGGLWARGCVILGAAAWAGMAVLARVGIARIGAIELLFLFAPLVIVPLGMELGRLVGGAGALDEIARRLQFVGAGFAVAAIWLPLGRRAGWLALGWMVVCLLMAASGATRFLQSFSQQRSGDPAVATRVLQILGIAQIDLAVGGAWFVASRLGLRPMGIQEPIGLLTAVHFHFAGFATATIGAATLRFAEGRRQERWLRWFLPAVVGMPYVVAAGFVISPALKMGAAILFSASVAGLAVMLRSCGKRAEQGAARVLLQAAAIAIFAGMVLSGAYAVADFVGSDVLTIPQMARTHGILNAVGFCMAGLLGWIVESARVEAGERS